MHSMTTRPTRRHFVQVVGATALALSAPALRAQPERRYAVVSLIGDQLDVVYAQMTTGTHLDPNVHRVVPDPAGTMDQVTLAAVGRALDQGGPSSAALLSMAPSPLHERGDSLSDGSTIALPGSLIDAVEQSKATHLVLVTKQRAEASVALRHSHVGSGKLRGLGYYIDTTRRLRVIESGATGRGLIAPYAYFRLTLADAGSGAVLSERRCLASRAYAVAASKTAVDPWEVLDGRQKVDRLRLLLEKEVAREVPLLVGA
jgi:hypothetical protein